MLAAHLTDGDWILAESQMTTVESDRLNVVKDLNQTNQIVNFGRNRHLISL
jgi:hypothetical protein